MTDRFRFYSRSIRSSIAGISAATAWIRQMAARHGVAEDTAFRLDLCANELLDNVAEHGYRAAEGSIGLELFLDRDAATLTVIDDAPPFDPGARASSPQPAPRTLAEAGIGGLGLKLVEHFADSIGYERIGSQNRVTVRVGGRPLAARANQRRTLRTPGFPLVRADGTRIDHDQRMLPDRRSPHALADTPLFHGAPATEVERIVSRSELRTCEPRDVLFRAGEHHRCVLISIDGRLEVHLDAPDSAMYIDLGPGECVGELSVADGKPMSAWVVAATACRLLVIPEPVFVDLVLAVPEIARNLVVILSERMRRSNLQIVARTRATMELETIQRELDVARQIQSSMLPAAPLFAHDAGLSGFGFMRAAHQVGGDFYDAFGIADGRAFIAIGDVCGKGMPAALFMVRTLTVVRSEASSLDVDPTRTLARLARRCNELLVQSNDAHQFVTLFCGVIDPKHRTMHYVNAGHCPPIVRTHAGRTQLLQGLRNPLIGIVPGLDFKVGRIGLPADSLIVLYTDGVTEAERSDGEQFGEDRLLDVIATLPASDPAACANAVVDSVDRFVAQHPQSDDLTMLALAVR